MNTYRLFLFVLGAALALFDPFAHAQQQINLQTQVRGVLPQANGGTGTTSLPSLVGTPAAGDLSYWTSSTAQALFIPSNCLILGGSASAPTCYAGSTLTAGQFATAESVAGVLTGATLSAKNAQTGTYQVLAGDFTSYKTITVASGTFTITLVASGTQPANGTSVRIVNYGSGVVTVARSGQNINGGTTSLTIPAASATAPTSAWIMSDGTDYFALLAGGSSSAAFSAITGATNTTAAMVVGSGASLATSGTGTITASNAVANIPLTNPLYTRESVTAGTTQTQAGATALSATANIHDITVGNNDDGIRMPTCNAGANGAVHWINATSGNKNVFIYGAGTDTINSIATATGQEFLTKQGMIALYCEGGSPGNWISTAVRTTGASNQLTVSYNNTGELAISLSTANAPTLASGGCTSPSAVSNSAAAWTQLAVFSINVGTGCTGSQPLVFTLDAASTGWNCTARNTTNAATSAPAHSSAVSATSVTITSYGRTTGLAGAWTDNDVVAVTCARQ